MMPPYFSPSLPVVIESPGRYVTRCGEIVEITAVNNRGTAFCSGHYGSTSRVPERWHRSGRIWAGRECANDIVAII